jgi:hypothetical protein
LCELKQKLEFDATSTEEHPNLPSDLNSIPAAAMNRHAGEGGEINDLARNTPSYVDLSQIKNNDTPYYRSK